MKCLLTITLIATFFLVTHAQDSSTTSKTSSPAANIIEGIGAIFKDVSNSLLNQSGLEQIQTGLNIVSLVLTNVKTILDRLPKGSEICASVPQTAGYLGCFPDNSARVLNGATTVFRPNTIERCVAYCRQLNFKYAGAQYGEHFFCGNTMNQLSERLGEEKCKMACPGNAAQKCGDVWTNSIYTT